MPVDSSSALSRRTLLKLLAAAAVTGCGRRGADVSDLHVVVTGAGIVGASIAYFLAKGGASVTVVDKTGPASHASRGTFAWVNATWAKQPRYYHSLSQDGVLAWHELQRELDLPVRWGGSLEWFEGAERQELLAAQIAEQADWGEPARMVGGAEFADLEPNVLFPADQVAAYSGNDGAVDPVASTLILLEAAKLLGATVRFPTEVLDVSMSGSRLQAVETSDGTIEADRLIVATGAAPDMPRRLAGIDVPQRSTPGIILLTTPMPRLLNRVVIAPGIHMHQRDDGRIVLGEQDGAPQTEAHAARLAGRPNDFPSRLIAEQHGERMLAIARRFLPGIADAGIDDAYIGWRPLPIDGHPVLGTAPDRPDIYLAVMHSGVSLAPIVGRLVSRELLDGESQERLAPFRPGRSFEEVRRY